MPFIEFNGQQIEVDEDGFIQDPSIWTKELAEFLAKTEEVEEMTEKHWKLVNYLHDYYEKFELLP